MIQTIAFDADDTLWENENFFYDTQKHYTEILKRYASKERILQHLQETQIDNLELYGYGIKAFTLSMLQAAIELSDQQLTADETARIMTLGREMLTAPVVHMPNAKEVLDALHGKYRLITITKGDLLDQNRKMKRSDLAEYFDEVVVVSEKNEATYQQILDQRGIAPENFLMVGNSMKSDILPILNIGGYGVYVPYEFTWQHEVVKEPVVHPNLFELKEMGELLNLELIASHPQMV